MSPFCIIKLVDLILKSMAVIHYKNIDNLSTSNIQQRHETVVTIEAYMLFVIMEAATVHLYTYINTNTHVNICMHLCTYVCVLSIRVYSIHRQLLCIHTLHMYVCMYVYKLTLHT